MKWVYEKKKKLGTLVIRSSFLQHSLLLEKTMLHVTASGFILKMLHVFDAIREIVYFTSTD